MKGFVNPYNFIKLPQNKTKAYDDTDIHTGVIEYTITTKTPLFIPNSSSENAFMVSDTVDVNGKKEHKSYDFFSYTELDTSKHYDGVYHMPVIPGSEMRGVIRNIYETLTDSCMGMLNEETYPVKRSANRFTPALMHKDNKGNIRLLEASSLRIGYETPKGSLPKGFDKYHNGSKIVYSRISPQNIVELKDINNAGTQGKAGYLIKWGMGVKKKRYHIFVLQKNSQENWNDTELTRDVIERKLMPVIDSYLSQPALNAKNEKAYKEYRDDLMRFLKEKRDAYFPVTCSCTSDNKIFYLAPAIFSKEVSDNNIGTLAGEFNPCKNEYCPACDLFGHIGKDGISAQGSKIRFSDMYVNGDMSPKDYYATDFVTIPALAEPKLGNTEFYLERKNNADFWTYDYFTKGRETSAAVGTLRGRKYYWHHANKNVYANIINNKTIEPVKLNKTIRPVKDGVSFTGKVYFDGISNKQLKQLIWILNSKPAGIGYKLGGVKPYGLGSIVSSVDDVRERVITLKDSSIEYEEQKVDYTDCKYEDIGFSKSVKSDFIKISGLNRIPDDVEITYPKTENQKNKPLDEGYKWFMGNHATKSGKGMPKNREDIVIRDVLPKISEIDVSLAYNKEKSNNKSVQRYNKNHSGNNNYAGHKKSKGGYAANNKH